MGTDISTVFLLRTVLTRTIRLHHLRSAQVFLVSKSFYVLPRTIPPFFQLNIVDKHILISPFRFVPKVMKGQLFNRLREKEVIGPAMFLHLISVNL